jgi:hypothetical protein
MAIGRIAATRRSFCLTLGMANTRTVYHVVPDAAGEQWLVTQENDDSMRDTFRTKQEAIDAAKHYARGQEPSQVTVHKSDGNMEYESTYGDDPRRTPS